MLAPHPAEPGRADAFWIVAGRIADWGPLPGADELAARTKVALAAMPSGAWLPADELMEARIVGSWLVAHEDAPVLELGREPDERALAALVARLGDAPVGSRRSSPAGDERAPRAAA